MLLKLGTRTLGEMLLVIALLAVAVPLPAWKNYEDSQAPTPVIRDQCTFSDGSTISFGQKALGGSESGHNVWQAGKYDATMLRVSGRTDVGIKMSAGTYTIFVLDKPEDRPDLWTLIISTKTGHWGMTYPGKQYDLGRTRMGSNILPATASLKSFTIGCLQNKDAPIFMWMQSGTHVAYTKTMVQANIDGKREWLWH